MALGGFGVAAKSLNLTQPAVSHSIKNLESTLGCQLFKRVGNRIYPTVYADQLLKHVDGLFRAMQKAREEITRLSQWGMEQLHCGLSPALCEHFLPKVLEQFQTTFPKCDVVVEAGDSSQIETAVTDGRLDLGITLSPIRSTQSHELAQQKIFEDELMFVVSEKHPWAKRGRANYADMPDQMLILYDEQISTHTALAEYFEHYSVNHREPSYLGSIPAIVEMVKLNIGISILAPWVLGDALCKNNLVTLPLGRRKLTRKWVAQFKMERKLNWVEESFLKLFKRVTPK